MTRPKSAGWKRAHGGLVYQHQERLAAERANSPKGRAGHVGGLLTARLYAPPARDEHGRFVAGPRPRKEGQRRIGRSQR